MPGDEVIVAPGIYREVVNPVNGGKEGARIVYRSEQKKEAVITGAEPVKSWEALEGTVWKARIPNRVFGEYNPYTTLVYGDWYVATETAHTGDVYLNGKSMYEVTEFNKVLHPERSGISWDPEFSVYVWYTEQDEREDETILYTNFQGKNPNRENLEISVRKKLFLSGRGGSGLYHPFRFYGQTGGDTVGAAHGLSGGNDRPALVKGLDYRGL